MGETPGDDFVCEVEEKGCRAEEGEQAKGADCHETFLQHGRERAERVADGVERHGGL